MRMSHSLAILAMSALQFDQLQTRRMESTVASNSRPIFGGRSSGGAKKKRAKRFARCYGRRMRSGR